MVGRVPSNASSDVHSDGPRDQWADASAGASAEVPADQPAGAPGEASAEVPAEAAGGAPGLTVVMYHYVRDLARSRFPSIKGRTVEEFRGQLAWLSRRHRFVRVEELLAAWSSSNAPGARPLPERCALLTFDDGYSDHYRYVFPILDELGIQGCFFPPVRALRDRAVLDVNKIHFALAAAGPEAVAGFCRQRLEDLREEHGLEPLGHYLETYARPSRLDPAETVFVKRVLQRGLPEAARARICGEAFRRFVTADEAAFAEELYLSPEQVRTMRRAGMHFGAHGVTHRWLDSLDREEQAAELRGSRDLLDELGFPPAERTVAYPYGGLDEVTIEETRAAGFSLGFTTEPRIARPGRDDPLRIPRLDTVDLPCETAEG